MNKKVIDAEKIEKPKELLLSAGEIGRYFPNDIGAKQLLKSFANNNSLKHVTLSICQKNIAGKCTLSKTRASYKYYRISDLEKQIEKTLSNTANGYRSETSDTVTKIKRLQEVIEFVKRDINHKDNKWA